MMLLRRLLIMFLSFTLVLPVRASFDDLGAGGRAPGMADTFVGVADDANATMYNPAGLANLKEGEVATEYSEFLKGLDDGSSLGTTYVSYAHPLRRGVLGMAYHNFKAANLLSERMLILAYGWKLKVEPFGWRGKWSLGGALKQLHRQYEPDRFTENALNDGGVGSGEADPLFARNGYSKDAYTADAGVLYEFGENYKYGAGLSVKNITQPDVSLGGDGDKAPMITKFGLAMRPKWGIISTEVRRAQRLQNGSPDTDLALGAERRFALQDNNAFSLRGGYATGSRGYRSVTAGASYQLGRAILDYAFMFPVGNLNNTDGSHRVGFSFKMGTGKKADVEAKEDTVETDILKSFELDSLAARAIYTRAAETLRISGYKRLLALQLLMKKYAVEDPGLLEIGKDLSRYLDDPQNQLMSWADLKLNLFSVLAEEDGLIAEDALEYMKRGEASDALARLGLLSTNARATVEVKSLVTINLAELAARSYREQDLESTIENMRQIIEIVPKDPSINAAYRQLLLMKMRATPIPKVTPTVDQLPEAPAALTAPVPVTGEQAAPRPADDFDVMVRNYGTLLGYYIGRKQAGAPAEERRVLLNQLKALFGKGGLDMSFVDDELRSLGVAVPTKPAPAVKPTTTPKPAPAAKPTTTPKPAPKPTSKPAPANPELDRAWQYYNQAVQRGITDSERIELLENMLRRGGEGSADKILKELEKVRKRLE